MAWYLSEVVSDIAFLMPVLAFYADEPETIKPIDGLIDQVQYLPIHLDHVDLTDIPAKYQNDINHWVAKDIQHILTCFKLLKRLDSDEYLITDQGISSVNLSEHEILKRGLNDWENDQGIKPFHILKQVLDHGANEAKYYPCNGLFLLEIMQLLIGLNNNARDPRLTDAIEATYLRRDEIFAAKGTNNPLVDTMLYTNYLWDMLGDINYLSANYSARATTMLMMHSDDLIYEQLHDKLFGLVQTITVAR